MKKYFFLLVFVFLLISSLSFSSVASATISSQPTTIAQLVELLISIGVISADKAVVARTVVSSFTLNPNFTVSTSTSYVQVLSPNGGESWSIDLDLPYSIKWGSSNLPSVFVSLIPSSSKNPICNLSPLPIVSKNGNNTLSVLLKKAQCYNLITGTSTPLTAGVYKVRVSYTDSLGTIIKDESNATFKIMPKPVPVLKVTYPNGGETLIRNQEYDVKYKFTDVTNVDNNLLYLYLYDSEGNLVYNSHRAKRSDGVYSLDLPSSLKAGAYKIKLIATVIDNGRVEIEDSSDNFFWISTGL
jgi:hypothetical protein